MEKKKSFLSKFGRITIFLIVGIGMVSLILAVTLRSFLFVDIAFTLFFLMPFIFQFLPPSGLLAKSSHELDFFNFSFWPLIVYLIISLTANLSITLVADGLFDFIPKTEGLYSVKSGFDIIKFALTMQVIMLALALIFRALIRTRPIIKFKELFAKNH